MDERLSEEERLRVQRHLEACPTCMEEMESLRYTVGLLRRVAMVAPRGIFTLAEAPAAVPTPRPLRGPSWAYGAVASLAAVLFAVVLSADLSGSLAGEAAPIPEVAERKSIAEAPVGFEKEAVVEKEVIKEVPVQLESEVAAAAPKAEMAEAAPLPLTPVPQMAAAAVKQEAPVDDVPAREPQLESAQAERETVDQGISIPSERADPTLDESEQVTTTAPQPETTTAVTAQPAETVPGETSPFWHVLEGVLGGAAVLIAGGLLWGIWRRRRRVSS